MTDVIAVPPKTSGPKMRKARSWVHRIALALAVVTPLLFMAAALGTKFGLWGWYSSIVEFPRGMGKNILLGTFCFGVLALLTSAFVTPRKGWWIGVLALLVGGGGMFKAVNTTKTVAALPFIHDVSTDTQNPPSFTDVILDERAKVDGVNTLDYIGKMAPYGEGYKEKKLVSVLQTSAYPEVRSLILEGSPDVVFGEALAIAKSMGWKIKAESVETGAIEATAETFWYGFKDDVAIRVKAAEGGGSIVDVRSISRVGGSDLGANAARVKAFLEKMRA